MRAAVRQSFHIPLPPQQWERTQKRRNNPNSMGWKRGKRFPEGVSAIGSPDGVKGVTVGRGRRGQGRSSRFGADPCEGAKTEKGPLTLHSRVNSHYDPLLLLKDFWDCPLVNSQREGGRGCCSIQQLQESKWPWVFSITHHKSASSSVPMPDAES